VKPELSDMEQLVYKSPKMLSTVAVFTVALTSMAMSFVVTGLGELNAASGAFQASFFVGIFPSLIAYYLLELNSTGWQVALFFLFLSCCTLSCMGFAFVDNNYESLEGDGCMWRGSIGRNATA